MFCESLSARADAGQRCLLARRSFARTSQHAAGNDGKRRRGGRPAQEPAPRNPDLAAPASEFGRGVEMFHVRALLDSVCTPAIAAVWSRQVFPPPAPSWTIGPMQVGDRHWSFSRLRPPDYTVPLKRRYMQ